MEKDIQKAKELANCQYINPNSSKLLESRRMRRIKQIFDLLDTDKVWIYPPFSSWNLKYSSI